MEDDRVEQPESSRNVIIAGLLGIAAILALYFVGSSLLDRAEKGPDPETIMTTSLEALQAQNRLVPFTARFVSVVTSRQERFAGLLDAERTLILPGTARYEIDMAKIDRGDLDWDEASQTLTITIPDIEIAGPEVDLTAAREYGETGILGAVTDADELLTRANQQGAIEDLRKQAGGAVPLGLAREAARDAVRRNFELPLRAAGIKGARVDARFRSDPQPSTAVLDHSTSYDNALAEAERRRNAKGE